MNHDNSYADSVFASRLDSIRDLETPVCSAPLNDLPSENTGKVPEHELLMILGGSGTSQALVST